MAPQPLIGIKACVFDAYGTLFDYGSAAARCRDVLGDNFERFTVMWRDKQIGYTWWRAAHGRHADFWAVTGDALDFVLDTLGIADAALRARLMDLYLTLEPFPDARAALEAAKASGRKTAILSNGSPAMLAPLVANAGFGGLLDAVWSRGGARRPERFFYSSPTPWRSSGGRPPFLFLNPGGPPWGGAFCGCLVDRVRAPPRAFRVRPGGEIASFQFPGLGLFLCLPTGFLFFCKTR